MEYSRQSILSMWLMYYCCSHVMSHAPLL